MTARAIELWMSYIILLWVELLSMNWELQSSVIRLRVYNGGCENGSNLKSRIGRMQRRSRLCTKQVRERLEV